jgi:chaperonin GroEL
LIAVVNAPLRICGDVQSILESASQWPENGLLLFAPQIEGEALVTMILNEGNRRVRCCAVQSPGFGDKMTEHLKDIAALSKAILVDPTAGMNHRKWQAEWFGSLRKATVKFKSSFLQAYDDAHEGIQDRVTQLKTERDSSSSDFDRDRFNERIAKLSGGMAVLKVGGVTEAAMKERRARIEDALSAVRAALREGVVPGGGVAYLVAAGIEVNIQDETNRSSDERAGWEIVIKALKRPVEQLVNHAGKSGPLMVSRILDRQDLWVGWDANQDRLRPLDVDPAILDPVAVVISVINAAVSVASTLLTVETSITRRR